MSFDNTYVVNFGWEIPDIGNFKVKVFNNVNKKTGVPLLSGF